MAIEIRTCSSTEELKGALAPIWQYFGSSPTDESTERFQRVLRLERMHAAFDGDRIVGGAGAFEFRMAVPGGALPCAGVTVVGVDPTHRRRGVLTQMMRAQLEDAHARGEPIASLWASEETIYGRFGYGLAAFDGELRLPKDRAAFVIPVERAEVRFVEVEEALATFPQVYDRVFAETPGMFERSPEWWETRVLSDPEARRQGGGEARRVLAEADGRPVAYAIYRHHPSFDHGLAIGWVSVVEAMGVSPATTAGIWRYLLDIDWAASVRAELLPLDHPLFFLLAEPRRMQFTIADAIWVRLVDVGEALSGRSYAGDGEVVFEVEDPFCPWNDGRWRLAGGVAERGEAEADLRLPATALGSVYLGGVTFAQLERAGRLEELRPGALQVADALFRTDKLPWCPEIF